MENDRITKRMHMGVCEGSRSVGRPRKRWSDSVNECLNERGMNVGQSRRMVYEWWEFVRRNAWGVTRGINP